MREPSLRRKILSELQEALGETNVLGEPEEVIAYECDGLAGRRHTPDAVTLVSRREDVTRVVEIARKYKVPFLPRGAGTGLSGGAVPPFGGIIIELSRMKTVRELDFENRLAVVEPGTVNADLSRLASPVGYYFAPDPGSQSVSTIGGNLAENAGGPHCLKYGTTVNHVVSLEVVLPTGEVLELGSRAADCPGYDLAGLFVGSEGTFGIATLAVLKLSRLPQAVVTLMAAFPGLKDACDAVSGVIAAGITPATIEMMDRATVAAVAAYCAEADLPTDAGAVLIIELDGIAVSLKRQVDRIVEICRRHRCEEPRVAKNQQERDLLWKGRKQAFGTAGRMTRSLYLHDAVVPRNRLSEVVSRIYESAGRAGIRLASMSHAGDGNLHPILMFDRNHEGEEKRVRELVREMLRICVDAGGTLSGEHGIGNEKNEYMDMIFTDEDLQAMHRTLRAFNPEGLCNPGKIFPSRYSGKL